MVVTLAPLACPASTVQDLTARPSICTTQAPHWLVSQPTWVPVRFEMIAQEMDKKGPVFDLGRDRLAVHRQFDCRHVCTSRMFLFVSD